MGLNIMKLVSGVQSGADRAALDFAIEHVHSDGFSCGQRVRAVEMWQPMEVERVYWPRCRDAVTQRLLQPAENGWINGVKFCLSHVSGC